MSTRNAITRMQEPYIFQRDKKEVHSYEDSFESIESIVQRINTTEKAFHQKAYIHEHKGNPALVTAYKIGQYVVGRPVTTESWNELFGTQIDHVVELNYALRGLINQSTKQGHELERKLKEEIQSAQDNVVKYLECQGIIPKTEKVYEKAANKKQDIDSKSPEYFEALEEEFDSENKLLDIMQETSLLGRMHNDKISTIGIMRGNILFHKGIVYNAKQVAISTHQICKTLDHLRDSYNTGDLGDAVGEISQGLGLLRNHANTLASKYKSTYETVTLAERETRQLLSQNGNVGPVISQMLETLDEDLKQ